MMSRTKPNGQECGDMPITMPEKDAVAQKFGLKKLSFGSAGSDNDTACTSKRYILQTREPEYPGRRQ